MTLSNPSVSPAAGALRRARTLTLFLAAGIALGTLWPSSAPSVPFSVSDKVLHAAAFALLILPMALTDLRRALRLAPVCVAFGGLIELIQPSVGRGAEWADLVADALGVALGLAAGWLKRRTTRPAD